MILLVRCDFLVFACVTVYSVNLDVLQFCDISVFLCLVYAIVLNFYCFSYVLVNSDDD